MNDKLREFRVSKKLTKQEISNELGVSASYYEKVEYAQRNPSYSFVQKFKNRYPDVDTDSLFFSNIYT